MQQYRAHTFFSFISLMVLKSNELLIIGAFAITIVVIAIILVVVYSTNSFANDRRESHDRRESQDANDHVFSIKIVLPKDINPTPKMLVYTINAWYLSEGEAPLGERYFTDGKHDKAVYGYIPKPLSDFQQTTLPDGRV